MSSEQLSWTSEQNIHSASKLSWTALSFTQDLRLMRQKKALTRKANAASPVADPPTDSSATFDNPSARRSVDERPDPGSDEDMVHGSLTCPG